MKLMNKKTGEIIEFDAILPVRDVSGDSVAHLEYNSLTEFNAEWEDYEEPKGYWFIGEDCCPHRETFEVTKDFVDRLKEIGNYFKTREEAEKAVEKLKAWKRLEDKGFRFIGKTYETDKRFGSIFYKVDEDTYSEDIIDDLDLIFGGEE